MTSNPVSDRKVAAARHDSALLLLSRGKCNPRVLNKLVKVDLENRQPHAPGYSVLHGGGQLQA